MPFNECFETAAAITVNDSTVFSIRRMLVNVTVAGNIKFDTPNSTGVVMAVSIGVYTLPIAMTKLYATGTTATATYVGLN